MFRIFKHYMPRSLVLPGVVEALILFGSVYIGMMVGSLGSNPADKLVVGDLWTRRTGGTATWCRVAFAPI